MPKIDYSYTII